MKHYRSFVAAVFFYVLTSASSAVFAEVADKDKLPLSAEEWQQYRELSKRIKENYVDPVDDKRLFNACLSGMGRLDPHSEYLDAEATQNLSGGSGSAGVGLELQIKNSRATVVSVIEGSPAAQTGIRPGDCLFKIDNEIVAGLPLDKVVHQLRGEPGSALRLTVLRDGSPEPLSFDLTRKNITVQIVKSRLLEPGYGYIRITAFHLGTIDKFVAAMQSLDKQSSGELKGLVLDLRNNPGGLFDKALALAGAFLPHNAELVSIKGRAKDMTHTYTNNFNDNNNYLNLKDFQSLQKLPLGVRRVPLVVLVNNQSAAGVEIVVGALQDYRRALILGTPTFGKDSIQTLMALSDKTALKLTTARWQTPNGRSSAPAGIAPDIFVAATSKDALQESDPALERALASLKSRYAADTQPEPSSEQQAASETLRKEAIAAGDAHNTAKAIELWSRLLKDRPDDAQALRLRGARYAEEGKRGLASADHLRAVELEPESASTWSAGCWSKILLGDFTDAQPDCKKAVALNPGNLSAVANLGHTWLLQGDKDKAWSRYEAALLLIESKEDLDDILADFDLFKKRGWQPELSQTGDDWFAEQGKAWLARRASADKLLFQAHAAEAAKDIETELKLRIKRLDELEKLLPATHPSVIFAAKALADTHMQVKQPDKAVPLYLRVMNYLNDLDGNPPRGLITTINKITEALNAKEYTGKATRVLEKMLDVMKGRWGTDNQNTQSLIRRLATEYIEENPSRALELSRNALAYQELLDAPVEKRLGTMSTILRVLGKLNLNAEGIYYLEKMLALLNQHQAENPKAIIAMTESLADAHALIDHPDQSLAYYKQVLEMRRGVESNVANYGYISTLSKTGRMLSHFGRLEAATPYLEEALHLAETLFGKDSPTPRQMAKSLEEHKLKLEKGGKPEADKAP